ncbi:MAG: 2OG-Fe(II) oxygenase [Gammaproteobacteria bacterium]|nr:2OG-Fe(II) oxygenase [Gammaproteobacteria bacterium]
MSKFIEVYEQALSDELCNEIIERFEQSPNKKSGRVGGGVDDTKKNSTDLYMSELPEWRDLNQRVMNATFDCAKQYFAKHPFLMIGTLSPMVVDPDTKQATTVTIDNFERLGLPNLDMLVKLMFRSSPINVQKYQKQVGGYPLWHSEIYPLNETCEHLHRSLLFLVYLNDIEEGGETEFHYQQLKVKPKKGSLVIAPAGFTHTHRGNTPISDDKYVLAGWIMFNRAENIYTKK